MTHTGRRIEHLISYDWGDWAVTSSEEASVIALLRGDTLPDATIRYLNGRGRMRDLLDRVNTRRESLMQALGGQIGGATATLIRPLVATMNRREYAPSYLAMIGGGPLHVFDVSHDLQQRIRPLGVTTPAAPIDPRLLRVIGPTRRSPFTGVGATGVGAPSVDIPAADQVRLAAGHDATRQRYSNPLGDLGSYLRSLTPRQRLDQARLLVRRPVVSVVPLSYSGDLPSRGAVFRAAADLHQLEPELVAAFVLAEQRDQSQNEDAVEFSAASSFLQRNTSIGLGQVVVSTAVNADLFADLLSPSVRGGLDHRQVAYLLTSDEFNIFAAARYIRRTADRAPTDPARLPNTLAMFPGTDLSRYRLHSRTWPDDNIKVLACEYTSAPWDDDLKGGGWGWFVHQCYRDLKTSAVSFT